MGLEVSYINYARLMHRHYRKFAFSDPLFALQYICAIGLAAVGSRKELQLEQRSIVSDYVKELVIDSKAYGPLLGVVDADGQKLVRLRHQQSISANDTMLNSRGLYRKTLNC